MEISKVISRACKATGPNKHWWKVEVMNSGEEKSVHMAAVTQCIRLDSSMTDIIPTLVVNIPRHLHDEPECMQAKERELNNWDDFGV